MPAIALASPIYVTDSNDADYTGACTSTCTIRDAFDEVNASSGDSTIVLTVDSFLTRTGTDDTNLFGDLDLCKPVPGRKVTITGNDYAITWASSVLKTNRDRVIHVVDQSATGCYPVELILDNVHIGHGYVSGQADGGAGIASHGPLTIIGASVAANELVNSTWSATGPGGGAIQAFDSLYLTGGVNISQNEVTQGNGGAVEARGDLTIDGAFISGNSLFGPGYGAGVRVFGPTVTASIGTAIIGSNHAGSQGGGLWADVDKLTVWNVDLVGNASANGAGAFIHLPPGQGSDPLFDRSALTENNASLDGGGLYLVGSAEQTVSIVNTTISSNTGDTPSIYLAGGNFQLDLIHATITRNENPSGDYFVAEHNGSTTVTWFGSLIDGRCRGSGAFASLGYSVIATGSLCPMGGTGDTIWGSPFGVGPLTPLMLGQTRLHPVSPFFVAHGIVTPCGVAEDQKGVVRATDCDAGSDER